MVQDQLVDYIAAQIKSGASREAVRTTLLGVGWQAADIDDSLRKIDDAAATQPSAVASSPVAAARPTVVSSPIATAAARPAASSASSASPHVIRMSDLVSSAAAPVERMSVPTSAAKMSAITKNAKITETTFEAAPMSDDGSKKGMVIYGILGVVIVVFGGIAVYLYVQNNSLSSEISSVKSQSTGVTSQVSSLTSQVAALTASDTALAASTAGLASANQELMTELSFYAALPGAAPTTTALSVAGSLGVNASKNYFVVASYGGKVFVANSKDAKVAAALAPLVGKSTQLEGTIIPGSETMTVIAVNGNSL